jgi:N-formylglutamate amidohydrolase
MRGSARPFLLAALTLAAGALATFEPRARAEGSLLVTARRGDLPIVIAAPHGGDEPIPGVAPRKTGVSLRDENTLEVAEALAARLEVELSKRPFLVLARFHRKYADANRAEGEAFEDDRARPHYAAYHAAIRSAIDEAERLAPGRALLLEIHGQSRDPDTIHRGTHDRKSVKRLLERRGADALSGPASIFGALAAAGYKVFPPVAPAPPDAKEDPEFNGAYTVGRYGSQNRDGVDTISIEIGRDFREKPERRDRFAADLVRAIAKFYKAYVAGSD